jgi:hypothetical protein
MLKLLIKNDKIHNKSEHGCCDYKTCRNMTCAEKRDFFFWGWLFAVWEGRVGMGKKKEK